MHLDTHSWYSFHLGVSSPAELVAHAAELGHTHLGLCDLDGTYGLLSFHRAALKCGVRPVLGIALTAPVGQGRAPASKADQALPAAAALTRGHPRRDNPDRADAMNGVPTRDLEKQHIGSLRLTDKTWHAGDARHGVPSGGGLRLPDAVVLARNRDGYSMLCALAAGRQLEPRWDIARALYQAGESCFVITDREELLRYLAPRLGPERLFVRLSADYGPAYRAAQVRQRKLAERFRLRPCACTDVCFVRPQDRDVHHLLCAIGQNTSLQLAHGVRPRNHYLAAPTELGGLFYQHPEALATARGLAERCEVELLSDGPHFPEFPVGRGETPQGVLRELCLRGLQSRFKGTQGQEHLNRLDMELGVIHDLKFTSYFLFVRDILREANRRGISCLGRGSAANSLVSYVLGLTPLDPLQYDMYFERFLNPERKHSPPDIDIDFNWKRRDEVLQCIYDKWGVERVALISTHVTYRSKSALRETAKVFGLGDREISALSKYMPGMHAAKLAGDLSRLPELRGFDFSIEPYNQVLPLAARLAGKPRHLGIHCGGIVIAPGKITDFTGLQRAAKGYVVTQYEMHGVEGMGLVKFDVLGNRSLGVREDLLARLANADVGRPVSDLGALTRDATTQAMIRSGRTMGCFYIESPAMRQLLQQLQTDSFRGLTAASSVIRPGVAQSGMMQEYIRRVNGQPPRLPSHPLVDELLKETCGVMVFQEDVMRVAHCLAGFTPAEADLLRRAMNGKLRGTDQMHRLEKRWQEGCAANNVDRASADEIWRQLSSFSDFSFCKAHSASFATLSYQMAWLKAHHTAEFMAAVITNGGGFYGPQAYLSECRRLGLAVLPPDVNHSEYAYSAEILKAPEGARPCAPFFLSPEDARPDVTSSPRAARAEARPPQNAVRVGLGVIKSVNSELLQRIPAERAKRGAFAGLRGFIQRVRPQRAELETLVLCGALDSLGRTRPELLWEAGLLDKAEGKRLKAGNLEATFAGFSGAGAPARHTALQMTADAGTGARATEPFLNDYSINRRLQLELEHFGMVVSRHPLEAFSNLPTRGIVQAVDLPRQAGKRVRLLGWCIATKRVNIEPRSQPTADLLALQAQHLDVPEPALPEAGEEERESAAVEIGLIARGPDLRSGGHDYYAPASHSMKFMSMEDTTGTYEATLFPRAYAQFAPLTRFTGPFVVSGVVEEQFGVCSVNCDRLELLEAD
jgi:DNA polymerase III alpha subunit